MDFESITNTIGPILGLLASTVGSLFIALFGLLLQGGTFLLTILFYGVIILLISAFFVTRYILTGYAHSKIAEKFGDAGNFAWIPVFQQGFTMHLIHKITGKKRLVLFDKYAISNGTTAIWLWILVHYFGMSAIKLAVTDLAFVPVLGVIVLILGNLLTLIPLAAEALLGYAYIRDLLELFEDNKNKNITLAIIISIVDVLIGGGLARAILLMFYLKKEPVIAQINAEE